MVPRKSFKRFLIIVFKGRFFFFSTFSLLSRFIIFAAVFLAWYPQATSSNQVSEYFTQSEGIFAIFKNFFGENENDRITGNDWSMIIQ